MASACFESGAFRLGRAAPLFILASFASATRLSLSYMDMLLG